MPEAPAVAVAAAVKPGRHREASLYHALHGAGAGSGGRDGLSPEALREAARLLYEAAELPVWRRSGFWTTSLRDLDIDALEVRSHEPGELPELVTRALPERGAVGRGRSGRIVQLDGSVVHVELDPGLAERGVVLCSLEDALRAGEKRAHEHFCKRLTYDRHKLEAANAAFWTGGAYLYVPPGVAVEDPFEIVYAIGEAGVAQYGRTLVVGDRASDFRVHEHDLAEDFSGGQALHAGAFECYLHDGARCRLAQVQDWGPGEVFDVSTRFVGVGRDAYCHWLPSLLGGHLVRQHLELAVSEPGGDMAFRGLFFTEGNEHLDAFAVDLHETGPSGGDVHWRGAVTGESRASFEGLIQIDPGAQQTHTYLQIHTMMLSPRARLDAIPSVLVSADDVSASHGGTVGELDESAIFYMQSRGLDRPAAVRVLVEGFFEPLLAELDDEPLEELVRAKLTAKLASAREDIEAYATSR
ncbi:MAG TPA: SufD family Fe-S cluster assembly protein [Solirubrobacteraceae bacterium]|nr:SufD family Fe-S cluster assembly protein [Solirubrobacteraceae bacterium]